MTWTTESVEVFNNYRYEALVLAVQHAQGRQGYLAEDVIADAEEFLIWLDKTEVPDDN